MVTKAKKKKKGGSWIGTALALLVLVAGLGVIAYPTVSNWWNDMHQSQAIDSYAKVVDSTSEETLAKMLADAEQFNADLLNLRMDRLFMDDATKARYMSLLNLDGSGMIGYIEVPSIKIRYPIYHTTEEEVLQVAIGHLEGTSLPVGGAGTHSLLSGHRGLPSATLFSDLDQVKVGDLFYITVLNRSMTYEVDQIRIVEPQDVSQLGIDPDEDYVTLVTCTPYSINSHRMLVRGKRVTDTEEAKLQSDASKVSPYIVLIGMALPLGTAYLLVANFFGKKRKMVPTIQETKDVVSHIHEGRKKRGEADDDTE